MKYLRVKFPCGYEIEMKFSIFDEVKINRMLCPLHGFNCPKNSIKSTGGKIKNGRNTRRAKNWNRK